MKKNKEKVQEVQKRETIKLGENVYYLDSLSQDALNHLEDIKLIDTELSRLQLQTGITNLAKNTKVQQLQGLVSALKKSKDD